MENLSTEKVNLLRHNARQVVRELGLLNDAYFDIGVTLAERHLLIELSNSSCPTMGEIAERLLLDKSTASRLIAKAMKKGYIQCTQDERDKRKRFLLLTELGKKTLNAFEPIAFHQTKQALLTLLPEEIETVYRGVTLYAKGLKQSRLNPSASVQTEKEISLLESLPETQLEFSHSGLILSLYTQEDESVLYDIFKRAVDSGAEFSYESSSFLEFQRQFLAPGSQVYVCRTTDKEVIGGFTLRSNFSGRCAHIANAAYMIRESHRGNGIGKLLVNASLEIAKNLGFQAMQFNMVLSQNAIAVHLYKKLGFTKIGIIPEAIRNPDGSYQDGYIFYKKLK